LAARDRKAALIELRANGVLAGAVDHRREDSLLAG
jgi:hypothetical protein